MVSFIRVLWMTALIVASMEGSALAQERYPDRPIRFLVNGGAGSVGDTLARPIAQAVGASLGVPTIVENRPGAGGFASIAELMRSPADGYTVMLISATHLAWNQYLFKKLPYDPLKDLVPVSPIAVIPMVLVVNPSVPARSLEEFLALAKASPTKYNYGYGGTGTPSHVTFELFRHATGANLTAVAYKTGPAAIQDLIGGQIDAAIDGVPLLEPQVKSGRLRALAVTTKQRLTALPDVPTFAEKGFPNAEASIWVGVGVKAGTSSEIIAKLNREITKALDAESIRDTYARIGAEPKQASVQAFSAFVELERKRWGPIIVDAGIKLD